MENGAISQAESNENVLTFDVPDEAPERAASAERQASRKLLRHRYTLLVIVAFLARAVQAPPQP
jgi:hypothetical protein